MKIEKKNENQKKNENRKNMKIEKNEKRKSKKNIVPYFSHSPTRNKAKI